MLAAGAAAPHVTVYFAMALALFADEDYEEVAARLTETLASWGCWDQSWATPTSGGITQARRRLGLEPLELLFDKVAVLVAGELTRGAFLHRWRLMAIDGFELDVPDTAAIAAVFGYPAGGRERPAFPKMRVVTIGECGSHAKVAVRRHRSYPRVIRRAWHNSYRVKRPGDTGTRYHGPPTIKLVNLGC